MTHRFAPILITALIIAVSCSSPPVREEAVPATNAWELGQFARHLENLNPGAGTGRRGGSVFFASNINYVIAQARASGLHPGLHSGYSTPFITDRNIPESGRIDVELDTTRFIPGIDYAMHPASGTRKAELTQFTTGLPSTWSPDLRTAVMLRSNLVTKRSLEKMEALGYSTVLAVGPLTIESQTYRGDSVAVFQLTERAVGELMRVSRPGVVSILDGATDRVFRFPRSMAVDARSIYQPAIQEVNLVGLISGKAPFESQEIIVVGSMLESGGDFAGANTFNYGDLGIGPAVLIETSRVLAEELRYSSRPRRSVMFVHFGGAPGYMGVRAFGSNPLWSRSQIERVLLVGMEEKIADSVSSILQAGGLATERFDIEVPGAFATGGFLVRPGAAQQERLGNHAAALSRRDVRAAKDSAAVEAMRIGEVVYDRLQTLIFDYGGLPSLPSGRSKTSGADR